MIVIKTHNLNSSDAIAEIIETQEKKICVEFVDIHIDVFIVAVDKQDQFEAKS